MKEKARYTELRKHAEFKLPTPFQTLFFRVSAVTSRSKDNRDLHFSGHF